MRTLFRIKEVGSGNNISGNSTLGNHVAVWWKATVDHVDGKAASILNTLKNLAGDVVANILAFLGERGNRLSGLLLALVFANNFAIDNFSWLRKYI